MRAITSKVSHTPAGSLKPEKTSPPRVRTKLERSYLRTAALTGSARFRSQ